MPSDLENVLTGLFGGSSDADPLQIALYLQQLSLLNGGQRGGRARDRGGRGGYRCPPPMARSTDYSSDEEDSEAPQNGLKSVLNGELNGITGEEEKETPEPLDPKEVGMSCGYKNLYSGKEDRRGRFQWQDTIPTDVGKPAEDAETAKWALLVRNVKVWNDPRKTLAIHSIVVQSPLLKTLLGRVLEGYPGVTVGLRRLEFSGKFEPLIHRWAELEEAIKSLDKQKTEDEDEEAKKTKDHAELLYNILHKEFKTLIEESQDMMKNGVMTYEYLWTVFQPGHFVYARQDGQDTALKLHNTRYGSDRNGNPCFWVSGKYVDWDGSRFGTNKLNLSIYPYTGTRKIGQLAAYPLDYHSDKDALRERLIERGEKVEAFSGSHYKAYHGVAWNRDAFGNKDKHNIKGRIVIDTYGWNKFNPNWSVFVTPLNQKEANNDGQVEDDDDGDDMFDPGDEDAGGGMPMDGMFADEDGEATRVKLTTEQKMICTPLLRGYALKNKQWLNFFVNSVKEIEWSVGAFDSLVLPANQKELILGFTESQRKNKEMFDDVIEGKGKGIILLLCGPPGVGKTLTAESVAEEMRVPLYMMSAGDLGLDPRNIEQKLNNILEMCTKWNAILLLGKSQESPKLQLPNFMLSLERSDELSVVTQCYSS